MLYRAMNFPVKPVLEELEAISGLGFDYLFHEIVNALNSIGYDDTITLEVFSQERDHLKMSRSKIAAMFGHLHKDYNPDAPSKERR